MPTRLHYITFHGVGSVVARVQIVNTQGNSEWVSWTSKVKCDSAPMSLNLKVFYSALIWGKQYNLASKVTKLLVTLHVLKLTWHDHINNSELLSVVHHTFNFFCLIYASKGIHSSTLSSWDRPCGNFFFLPLFYNYLVIYDPFSFSIIRRLLSSGAFWRLLPLSFYW